MDTLVLAVGRVLEQGLHQVLGLLHPTLALDDSPCLTYLLSLSVSHAWEYQ